MVIIRQMNYKTKKAYQKWTNKNDTKYLLKVVLNICHDKLLFYNLVLKSHLKTRGRDLYSVIKL